MDKIINYLLLVIIFVFDPLAISLVVAANFAFSQAFPKREEEISIPEVFEDEEPIENINVEAEVVEPEMTEEERLKLYQVYGETGSIKEPKEEIEYEDPIEFDDEKSNIIPDDKDVDIHTQILELENYLKKERIGGINKRLEKDIKNKILDLQSQIKESDQDGLTLTY